MRRNERLARLERFSVDIIFILEIHNDVIEEYHLTTHVTWSILRSGASHQVFNQCGYWQSVSFQIPQKG